uniref:Uncharacterized protein n=1 Tax=Phytophthora fragariae TaxID=53985 RepID=A0A6A3DLT5_9STRA|nr:hypothetical protein PF009_g28298 [Phytophthora fragariae]
MQIVPTTHRRATVRAVASSGAAASPGGVTGAADASASVAGEAVPPPDVRQELENEIDRAADDVVRAVIVQRVEAAELGFVQFTDEDVKREQVKSVMVQTLKQKATYRGQRVFTGEDGIVHAEVGEGESRIILPAKMLESGRELVTHCSFLLPYSYPTNLLDQMAQDIALDLREEAIAAADIDPEDEESVPQEMPSTASEVSGVAQPASATVEADEQRPADRGLQVQPGVEAAPASAPRRAGQKRKQAAKPAVQQGLLDEADDTTDATTRTSRRKKARPARTASNSTQRDGVASRTRARIRLAPYTNEEAAGDRAGRDESPVRAYARAGVLDPESSNEVADQYADTVMEEAPVAEHAAEQPRGMNQQQEDAMTPSRRGEEQPGDVTVQPAPAHVPDEGDEEPRIYVFAGQGRRGVDSLVSPQPRLARL